MVTGGAGFIGSHLVERLLTEGHEVAVFDNFNDFYEPAIKRANLAAVEDQIEIIEEDLRDPDAVSGAFEEFKPHAVAHLGARAGVIPSVANPDHYVSCNVNGTFHVLEAAKRCGVERMIFASSSSVYGVNEKTPFAETDPINSTISPYAATKIAGEKLCATYAQMCGMQTTCLRLFTVYGPRQRPDLAISKFIHRIQQGQAIDRYGDGSTSRDYTYIDDIINGIMAALHHQGGVYEIFNLGGSETVSLKELIGIIETTLGMEAKINPMSEQAGDVPRTNADISKAGQILGYQPATTIREGISKYVEWLHSMKPAGSSPA